MRNQNVSIILTALAAIVFSENVFANSSIYRGVFDGDGADYELQMTALGYSTFEPSPVGGLRGGALIVPRNTRSPSSEIKFSQPFTLARGTIFRLAADFEYSTAVKNPNGRGSPIYFHVVCCTGASFWLDEVADGIHRVSVSASSLKNRNFPMFRLTNGWYRFETQIQIIGGEFSDHYKVSAKVSKISETNTLFISTVAAYESDAYNTIMIGAEIGSPEITLNANRPSGCKTVDNILIEGPIRSSQLMYRSIPIEIYHAVELRYQTTAGRTYYVEWTDAVSGDKWNRLHGPDIGDGGGRTIFHSTRTLPHGIFRVIEQ